jgi:catechol 2,3-dioxygenase-like lactoylglutathione lyase family enzyme
MTIDYGRPPTGGFAKLVSELLVEDIRESLQFWQDALGFEIAYRRPEHGFAYLERAEGAQIMLCERSGKWETAPLEKPFGRGVRGSPARSIPRPDQQSRRCCGACGAVRRDQHPAHPRGALVEP